MSKKYALSVEKKKAKEYLKYELSVEEIRDFADDLSRKIGELELKELAKKDVVKSLDADIAKIKTEISTTATKVKDKYEYRNVDCEVEYDYDKKTKTYRRLDTGERYKTYPLTEDELQLTMI